MFSTSNAFLKMLKIVFLHLAQNLLEDTEKCFLNKILILAGSNYDLVLN